MSYITVKWNPTTKRWALGKIEESDLAAGIILHGETSDFIGFDENNNMAITPHFKYYLDFEGKQLNGILFNTKIAVKSEDSNDFFKIDSSINRKVILEYVSDGADGTLVLQKFGLTANKPLILNSDNELTTTVFPSLPTGTAGQMLYHNGTQWAVTSRVSYNRLQVNSKWVEYCYLRAAYDGTTGTGFEVIDNNNDNNYSIGAYARNVKCLTFAISGSNLNMSLGNVIGSAGINSYLKLYLTGVEANQLLALDANKNIVSDTGRTIKTIKRVLTRAEILGLNTTPITLLPALTGNKVYKIVSITTKKTTYSDAGYNGEIQLGYDTQYGGYAINLDRITSTTMGIFELNPSDNRIYGITGEIVENTSLGFGMINPISEKGYNSNGLDIYVDYYILEL